MSKIAIIGGTGYAGGHIATEAIGRGHAVISVSRTAPSNPPAGVDSRTGPIPNGEPASEGPAASPDESTAARPPPNCPHS